MLGSRQEQQGGDASVNIQGRDISFGLSYSDARQVAIDVFEANFHRLSQVAASTAKQRAEQLLDDYLQKLAAENIQEVPEAQNPDFQYALFTAQREYARTGRQETGELLVQLLVDRTRATDHNLVQIVLNESLAVAPKLTPGQLDVLSLVFVLRYTKNFTVVSPDTLGTYLDQYILPFADSLPVKHSAYQHLDFTSCANIEVTQIFVEEILLRHYGALFSKGFSEQDIADAGMIFGQVAPLLLPCFNDMAWWQSRAMDDEVLDRVAADNSVATDVVARFKSLVASKQMDQVEVLRVVETLRPQAGPLFDRWRNTPLKNLTLTSVGVAIAHANAQRRIGESLGDLGIWI